LAKAAFFHTLPMICSVLSGNLTPWRRPGPR
jgi:hypothetical protein